MSQPLVTVFIPVFNAEQFIEEAINSILQQSYSNLELVIVDDGSTDRSSTILKTYQDPRINIITDSENSGISYTRNVGLKHIKGKYLALLDSDDVAMPDRLAKQVAFMEANTHIAMCGGHALSINEKDAVIGQMAVPVGEENASGLLMFQNTFINSTVMFRTDAVKALGGYYPGLCEDYELAVRIKASFAITNLDMVLTKYRLHGNNTTSTQKDRMLLGEKDVIREIFNGLGIVYNDFMVHLYHDLFFKQVTISEKATLNDYYELFSRLKKANNQKAIYTKDFANQRLFMTWYEIIRKSKTRLALYYLLKSPLFEKKWLTFKMLRKAFKQLFGIV